MPQCQAPDPGITLAYGHVYNITKQNIVRAYQNVLREWQVNSPHKFIQFNI